VNEAVRRDRRIDVLFFVVGLAGSGLSLSAAVGTLLVTILSLLQGDTQAATLGAWASGAMVAMAVCGFPAIWLGGRALLGVSAAAASRPGPRWFGLALLFPAALLAGTWFLARPSLTLMAIPVHIATAVLPVAVAILVVRVPGPVITPRRAWGQFLTGLWGMPPMAMALELVALIPLIAVTVAALATSPEALRLLESLIQQNPLSALAVEENAVRLLLQPWVIAAVFAYVAGLVPLIEEAVKSLSVVLIARRLDPASAFVGGAIGGAGYALFEALFLTQPDPSWLTTTVGRGGATMMHAFTAALTGWGISQVVHHRRWGRLALAYLTAVSMHALWNATAVGVGLLQLNGQLGTMQLPGVLRAAEQVGPIVLAALSLVAMVGLPLGARRLSRLPQDRLPFMPSSGGPSSHGGIPRLADP